MLLLSTGFRTRWAGPESFEQIANGSHARVFAGARPPTADAPQAIAGAVQIGYITRNGAPVGFAGSELNFRRVGMFIDNFPTDQWVMRVLATQQAAWFRICAATDDGGASVTAPRIDGDINTTSSELVLPDTHLVAGDFVGPLSFLYFIPPL